MQQTTDQMNIDDFVFSEEAGTPAGIEEAFQEDTQDQGIPIKARKDQTNQSESFVPTSVPQQREMTDEFGYIKRHQRKTSIDDRRVSYTI